MPGALQSDNRGDEDLAALAESVLKEIVPLLEQLKIMRAREGESLEAILHATLDRLAEATDGVAALRPEIEQRYQERLTQRLEAATGPEFNRQRLLEEVAVLVERSDISEELTRMTTHIGHFRELLAAGGEVGKKLDFLLQEMNREANTLLSKTSGIAGKGTRITELGPGHEIGDRKGPRTDSERGIEPYQESKRKIERGRNSLHHFGALGLGQKHAGERTAQAGQRRGLRRLMDHSLAARL